MVLKELYFELADRLGVQNIDDQKVKTLLYRKLNESYKEISRIFDWEVLKNTGEILTIANYTDGSASVTINSRNVTGSGTAWTSAMVGRYFKPYTGSNWYGIVAVNSTTSLTLRTPIIEATGSGTYTIWKRFYYLPSRVRKIHLIGKYISPGELTGRSQDFIHDITTDISTTGEPEDFAPYGADDFGGSYSTGKVSLTIDSNVVTGSGTSWLDNVEEGDRFVVSGKIYRVKRIESDTSIILLNYSTITVVNQDYTIEKDVRIGFQFYPTPSGAYILPYSYWKRVFDMMNENKDRPELPEDFDIAIIDGAEASRMRDLDDPKWLQKQLEFTARVKDLRAKYMTHSPKIQAMRPFIRSRK